MAAYPLRTLQKRSSTSSFSMTKSDDYPSNNGAGPSSGLPLHSTSPGIVSAPNTPRRKKKRYDVEGSDREDEGDALLGGLIESDSIV